MKNYTDEKFRYQSKDIAAGTKSSVRGKSYYSQCFDKNHSRMFAMWLIAACKCDRQDAVPCQKRKMHVT
jgi:hypothetical protein